MDVYEPREDTYLLAEQVKKYATGRVLEIGCGSGYIAKVASQTAHEVVAVDINPAALEYAREHNNASHIAYIQSDMFAEVLGHFDLIYFNPPYLPDDKRVQDVALDGGPEGWEVTARFLKEVKHYLKKDGKVLLLFSSLTKKDVVERLIKENDFKHKQLSEQKLFSEVLYVYELF